MKICMLKTTNGSTDGIRVSSYEADKEYVLDRTAGELDLANAFVAAGLAKEVSDGQSDPDATTSNDNPARAPGKRQGRK